MPTLLIGSAADLDFLLQDAGDAVVYGDAATFGILRRVPIQEPTAEGLVRIGTHITLTIREGALEGLADEQPITVAGDPYVIRDTGFVRSNMARTLTLVEA